MSAPQGAGFHGKLPARGDFITGNLPRSFLEPWDAWLQAGIAASRDQLGDRWLPMYLDSPIWRFVLSPGACGPGSWAGILMPSVDKVGRYFPLTIAQALAGAASAIGTVTAATPWFERAESLALRALDDDRLDLAAFSGDVAALAEATDPAPAGVEMVPDGSTAEGFWCAGLDSVGSIGAWLTVLFDRFLAERLEVYSIWWNGRDASVPIRLGLMPRLPTPDRFVHLLGGPAVVEGRAAP
jgi:type VI secretion system protein ImpM